MAKPLSDLTNSLDGLRGVLAVWVMFSHLSQFTDGPGGIIKKGGIAVDMFMFVSGFLMVWTVFSREGIEPLSSLSTWKKFLVRRFFRIAPLYFVSLIFAYVLHDHYSTLLTSAYSSIGQVFDRPFRDCRHSMVADVILHFSFLFGLFPCFSASNVLPDWSLSLEMQFYLVFPLMLGALSRVSPVYLALACVTLAGLSQNFVGIYLPDPAMIISYPQPSILPLRINCFFAGMCLAVLIWRRERNIVLLVAFLIGLVAFQRFTFIAIAAFFSILLIAKSGLWLDWRSGYCRVFRFADTLLQLRAFKVLGDISFGVYLTHLLVVLPLVFFLNSQSWFLSLGGGLKFVLLLLASSPVVFSLALLLHECLEKPMIKFGRNVTMHP